MKKCQYIIASLFVLVAGCKTEYEVVAPSKGTADFSTYVAIGNSLTAGYADGALYKSGQINSYPNMLAGQFKLAGGGDFKQPLMPDDNGGFSFYGTTYVTTKRVLNVTKDCMGVSSLAPVLASVNAAGIESVGAGGPYNNLGVPGVKSYQIATPLLAGSPTNPFSANPYYWRMASQVGTSFILNDALVQHPTFFTFWIGSNDVLLYALAGGEGNVGKEHVTGTDTVAGSIDAFLGNLIAGGAKGGAIANVPDITSIPYFTTVPYNGLLLDASKAAYLTSVYASVGLANITFTEGYNAFVIEDALALGGLRQIKSTEYLLLTVPQDSIKCANWGSSPYKPIPPQYVLDSDEIAKVKNATTAYNSAIASLATKYNLALVDMNQRLTALKSGIVYNGVSYNTTFVTGGAFSLDGVHLTPQGYAIVANFYIEAINAKYNSTLPMVDITKYPGIKFP